MDEAVQNTTEETSTTTPTRVISGVQLSEPEAFNVGDTVKVHYKIVEGGKTRIQPYEGIVISKRGGGTSKTFIVRRIGANNIGVERIFPLLSPNIEKIEVIKQGKVRRAKLFYLRDKKGRAATKVKELKNTIGITDKVNYNLIKDGEVIQESANSEE